MIHYMNEIAKAIQILRYAELDGRNGLPEDLFLTISGLVPLPNVDLLVINQKQQILLAWRDDIFFEPSWHIPGGCLRYGESFEHRIQQTALCELGTRVEFDPEPIAVRNVIRGANPALEHQNERGHNVAILFRCQLPNDFEINNSGKSEWENGYLRWFDVLPHNFMRIQHVYFDVLKPWTSKKEDV